MKRVQAGIPRGGEWVKDPVTPESIETMQVAHGITAPVQEHPDKWQPHPKLRCYSCNVGHKQCIMRPRSRCGDPWQWIPFTGTRFRGFGAPVRPSLKRVQGGKWQCHVCKHRRQTGTTPR